MKSFKQLSLIALVVVSRWLMAAYSGDVMSELSIETTKLRNDVLLNLKADDAFFFTATGSIRQLARRLPETSRATTVRALGQVVRGYVESATFKQVWLQDIRSYYPYDETLTEEYLVKKQQANESEKAAQQTQIAGLDQAFSQMDPAMLQMAVRAQIAQEESQLTALEGSERASRVSYVARLKKMLMLPPAEFKKQYLASLKEQALASMDKSAGRVAIDKEQLAQQRRQKAEFDAHADFRPLLKKRLQGFIALTETVDFEARLVPLGRKQAFANPVYERKPAEWKFLYRMGKEPVLEARKFAQQWLAELR